MDILLLGLNDIGASIGLALGSLDADLLRIGYDPDKQTGKDALEMGAVDELVSHPRKAAAQADATILSVPFRDVEDYLELLGEKMKEGAVIVDTARQKLQTMKVAEEILPETLSYIGMTPIVGSEALASASPGKGEPRADLFQGGMAAMVIPPSTNEGASDFVLQLVAALGAAPFFIEPGEHDAITAMEDGLPFILAAAFANMMTSLPNWREARRLAGTTFSSLTNFNGVIPAKDLSHEMHHNRELLLRKLDEFDAELAHIRSLLQQDDPEHLSDYLYRAEVSTKALLKARDRGDWSGEELQPSGMKEAGGLFGNLFGISPRPHRDDS